MLRIIPFTLILFGCFLIFLTTIRPQTKENILHEREILDKQKLQLILHDYENIAMMPIDIIISTLSEYIEICDFFRLRFENISHNLKNSDYVDILEKTNSLLVRVTILMQNIVCELKDLHITTRNVSSYEVFIKIIEKVDYKKIFLFESSTIANDLMLEVKKLGNEVNKIQSKGAIILYNSEDFQKAVKPLKSIIVSSIEMVEKILGSLIQIFSHKSFFNKRLEFLRDIVMKWKSAWVYDS